jgi:inorganic triphosphatase YgiF
VIELELTGGAPAALFDLARALAADVPLRLGVLSKFAVSARRRRKRVTLDV